MGCCCSVGSHGFSGTLPVFLCSNSLLVRFPNTIDRFGLRCACPLAQRRFAVELLAWFHAGSVNVSQSPPPPPPPKQTVLVMGANGYPLEVPVSGCFRPFYPLPFNSLCVFCLVLVGQWLQPLAHQVDQAYLYTQQTGQPLQVVQQPAYPVGSMIPKNKGFQFDLSG
jgi:hypothetical protein